MLFRSPWEEDFDMGIVTSSIVPPRAARPVIVRDALAQLTQAIGESRVTMVCAPAGSGKTTAMLYWAEELRKTGRPVLWLAARAGISDMPSFLLALEAAGVAAGLGWQGAGNSISAQARSEEHTSELQSLMRNSYAVFCLK